MAGWVGDRKLPDVLGVLRPRLVLLAGLTQSLILQKNTKTSILLVYLEPSLEDNIEVWSKQKIELKTSVLTIIQNWMFIKVQAEVKSPARKYVWAQYIHK